MNDLFISVKFTDKHAIRNSLSSNANVPYELIIKVKDRTFKVSKTAADFRKLESIVCRIEEES